MCVVELLLVSQLILTADYTKQITWILPIIFNLLMSVDDYRYKDSLIHDE